MMDASEHTADLDLWKEAGTANAREAARGARASGSPREPTARLVRTLEAQVIPRMLGIRRPPPGATPCPSAESPAGDSKLDVGGLVDVLLGADPGSARDYLDAVRARGVDVQSLYLDLLAPAARHLGELWSSDRCDFTEVTLGVGRLQQALRESSEPPPDAPLGCPRQRRVLLAPVSGDQHTFGLLMVAEFFRLAAWDVWGGPLTSRSELERLVAREWFDVVGLSVGGERSVEAAGSDIEAVRGASLNPGISVMVGGPEVDCHPNLLAAVHADATATDARQAPLQASALLHRNPRQP